MLLAFPEQTVSFIFWMSLLGVTSFLIRLRAWTLTTTDCRGHKSLIHGSAHLRFSGPLSSLNTYDMVASNLAHTLHF